MSSMSTHRFECSQSSQHGDEKKLAKFLRRIMIILATFSEYSEMYAVSMKTSALKNQCNPASLIIYLIRPYRNNDKETTLD